MTCQLQTLLHALQEDLAPGEAPRKQKCHKLLAFRSKLHCQDCQRGRPTTGGPYMLISLVIDWSHCPYLSPPPKKRGGQEAIAHQTRSPPKKKRGQHGRPMTGLSYRNESCMTCPPPVSPVVVLLLVSGGSFSPFGGSRQERCQSTSRHGTCCCYAQSSR